MNFPFPFVQSNKGLPAFYSTSVALTSGGTNTGQIALNADSVFLLSSIFGSCTADTDTDFIPNNFSLKLSANQSTIISANRIPQRNICRPSSGLQLPIMVAFPPNLTFEIDLLDLSGGSNTVTIVLFGYKIFNQRWSDTD